MTAISLKMRYAKKGKKAAVYLFFFIYTEGFIYYYLIIIYFLQISHGEGEEESDIFAIREVSFQPEGDSEWKETSYTLNTDSLDWVRF